MADEGYNTHAEIRAFCSMGPSIPTDAIITHWVTLIDAVIVSSNTSPTTDIAKVIEANRVSDLYWNLKKNKEYKAVIGPLTADERQLLSSLQPISLLKMYNNTGY